MNIDVGKGTTGATLADPPSDSRKRWLIPVIICSGAGALLLVAVVTLVWIYGNHRLSRHQVHGVDSTYRG